MTDTVRQTLSLDAGWRFHLGDVLAPLANKHIAAYMANKAGYARGAARGGFDDSDWRVLDLPHDWSIEGEYSPTNHLNAGFLPRGVAWYRRYFRLEEPDRGRRFSLRFDGVASHCTVYVNGHLLRRNDCGYTPFTIDFTDVATFGDDLNAIAVRVDATQPEGWWYEGAGIYRHAWLVKTSPVRVAADGVFVRPERRSSSAWDTHVETTIDNATDAEAVCHVTSEIRDPAGASVRSSTAIATVPARSSVVAKDMLRVEQPKLWDLAGPNLYAVHTTVRTGGVTVDDPPAVTFGYRTIHFDANAGFFLNGRPVKLKGTCNHQDHAGVGVAVPDSLHAFRVRRLLDMGSNAYRTGHHPPAPELLDACDRLGMLVMNENRNFGSSPDHLTQLRAMVLRDRNRPSVILWSLCNEEAIQGTAAGSQIARTMAAAVRELDSSRPVTAGVSGGVLGDVGVGDALDVMGINYQLATHDPYHAKHPGKPMFAAETHCAYGTRGTYETDPKQFVFASDDAQHAPWGATARETWRHVSARPFVAGMFAWTGFDYRGEPSPHEWPCVSTHWGILDACGFAKDAFFLHKAWFTRPAGGEPDEPFVQLAPHWNWPGREGQPIRVRAYTNCDTVELFLNGESLGRSRVDPIEMAEWTVPYRPGSLQAIAYVGDARMASTGVETTGPAVALGLGAHPSMAGMPIAADGHFALPVTVFALDARGRRVPTAENKVTFKVDGPGRIIGVGNGDPTCHEPDKGAARSLFRGLAQVIVQTTTTPGAIVLAGEAQGLKPAELRLTSAATESRPALSPAQRRHFVTDWRVSPPSKARPDAHQAIADSDMNTWERVQPGQGGATASARVEPRSYAVYRAAFTPPKSMQATGGTVVFGEVSGVAEVFLNGKPAATKTEASPKRLTLALPAAAGPVTLSVLIYADARPAGLTGAVELVAAR